MSRLSKKLSIYCQNGTNCYDCSMYPFCTTANFLIFNFAYFIHVEYFSFTLGKHIRVHSPFKVKWMIKK